MKISVGASTKIDYIASKEEFDFLGGRAAGTCYMPTNFEQLRQEPYEKTIKRSNDTKLNKHHSVMGHSFITLELEDIPKLFAMLLNNEKVYNTSEKSARYTNMVLTGLEKEIYDKWYNKLLQIITNDYGDKPYFTKFRIKKLAMENARYFTSVMTLTSMNYTVSYQQLNYLCGWMQKFKDKDNQIYKMLQPTAEQFVNIINDLGYLDDCLLDDGKNRGFSLVAKRARQEQFGECYSVNYKASFAMLAQAQRHRTLSYEMQLNNDLQFYMPDFLNRYPDLVVEWLDDMKKLSHITPQATLLDVNERGNYENLILKAKERLCTSAQLEIAQNTLNTINKYIKNTNNHFVKEELEQFNKGARCVAGFKCTTPCAFKEGVNLTRDI